MTDEEASLHIVRLLDGARENIWRAWTDPGELAQWWWPQRFETTYEVHLHEGGAYRFFSAELPDTGRLAVTGTFLEVRPPERLMYTWRWEQEAFETRVSVELTDLGRRTELCVRHEGLHTREDRNNHTLGWNDCLDRLQELVGKYSSS